MARQICVVVCDNVMSGGGVTSDFVRKSGAPASFDTLSVNFGYLYLRGKSVTELERFRRQRGQTAAQYDQLKIWDLKIGSTTDKRALWAYDVEEYPDVETGLKRALREAPNCVILMEVGLLHRFRAACMALGISFLSHYKAGELLTHYTKVGTPQAKTTIIVQ